MSRNKRVGVDDLVLLSKMQEKEICSNLKKRHAKDVIYTYIGEVLLAVNPFKRVPIYGPDQIDAYQGKLTYENPPHVFALAENAFSRMRNDQESQCIIISGESGSGKTETSKLIMQYLAKVSGQGEGVSQIKRSILESNPVLEAFGNAKTIRNNNSSRFGKYMEIHFDRSGAPKGGMIRNFLLEKSRVVFQAGDERNFHIFYQMCAGLSQEEKNELMVFAPEDFHYLNQSGCTTVPSIDDEEEFRATRHAMETLKVPKEDQDKAFRLLAGILWLGNIDFMENGKETTVTDQDTLNIAAKLLGVTPETLLNSLTIKVMQMGKDKIKSPQPVGKCREARDALAKVLYDRIFNWVVACVNAAMKPKKAHESLLIGILDVYGFEIFDNNSFEQFCINYVNEKLQQLFIELTLRGEQEEYKSEGIEWVPVKYFDNKVIVDLIEGQSPPGLMILMDDVCKVAHNMKPDQCDENYGQKICNSIKSQYLFPRITDFSIKHYAGRVDYNIYGFTSKNKDLLNNELIACMQSSDIGFFQKMFPEDLEKLARKRPTTASYKIRTQAKDLIDSLTKCHPHYIRCIKPNETKQPRDFDQERVMHQVKYLGLLENVRVRRAGFAYRREFSAFLGAFKILSKKTFPEPFNGSDKDGCMALLTDLEIDENEWQMGNNKVFLRHPETLFDLEERKERIFRHAASIIQRAYRKYKLRKYYHELKEKATNLYEETKQRRRLSINRVFLGDYVHYLDNAQLVEAMSKYTSVEGGVLFADKGVRLIKKFLGMSTKSLYVIVTQKALYFLERKKVSKRQHLTQITARYTFSQLTEIAMSQLADNYMCIKTSTGIDHFFSCDNKTELMSMLNDQYEQTTGKPISRVFENRFTFSEKPKKTKTAVFSENEKYVMEANVSGKKNEWRIEVAEALPVTSRPHVFGKRSESSESKQDGRRINGLQSGLITEEEENASKRRRSLKPTFNDPAVQAEEAAASNMPKIPSKAPPPVPKKEVKKYRCIYPYEAQAEDELTIAEDDIIILQQQDPSGWFVGSLERDPARIGLFPGNYTEQI